MNIRKMRLQRGWSQNQLAEFSGLSVRTIQRIERGHPAGLESRKSLAAVFEVDVSQWQPEVGMSEEQTEKNLEEEQAIEYVRALKGFYAHLMIYVVVITFLFGINFFTSPDYFWVVWPAMGWGLGVAIQALLTFEVFDWFGADWERRKIERRLGRKL